MDPLRFDEAIEKSFFGVKSHLKNYGTIIFVTAFTKAVYLFLLGTG
jgi:hypothetical protein